MMTFQAWLQQAIARLAESDSPRRDAEILLGHVTGRARTWILAFGETTLSADEATTLEALLQRRQRGNPLPIWSGSASSGRCRCSSPRRR
jgi:release factor glutamine methyltransferase